MSLEGVLYNASRSIGAERRNHMLQDHFVTQTPIVNEDWPRVFDEYDVQFLVLDPHRDSNLLKLFRSQPEWTVDFEDEETVLFVRADIARAHGDARGEAQYTTA